MQAIEIKYLSCTNNRCAKLKATCDAGSITKSIQYGLNDKDRVRDIVDDLIKKLEWKKLPYSIGQLKNNNYVAVFNEQNVAQGAN